HAPSGAAQGLRALRAPADAASADHRLLRDAGVDQHVLSGHAAAVLAGHEQRGPRDVRRIQAQLQALRVQEGLVDAGIAQQSVIS
ncbi:MAG: hypothetical protein ACKOD9_08465, partial [Rubrivivax sp.]